MDLPKSLLQLANADLTPAKLQDSALVLIDYQNEYLSGPLALPGAPAALQVAQRLLQLAREARAPIFHVAHQGRGGGMFDRDAERGQISGPVAPGEGETVVEKQLPNAFAGTPLHELIGQTGRKELIVAGFMTHMCVSSTVRAGLDLGYRLTVLAPACATRDLPSIHGSLMKAELLHEAALTGLADRFAVMAHDPEELA